MILNCHQYMYSHETYRDKQEEENKRPTQKRTWEMIKTNYGTYQTTV